MMHSAIPEILPHPLASARSSGCLPAGQDEELWGGASNIPLAAASLDRDRLSLGQDGGHQEVFCLASSLPALTGASGTAALHEQSETTSI